MKSAVDNILRQVVMLRETSKEFSDYASLRQVQKKPLDLRKLLEESSKPGQICLHWAGQVR